MRKLFSILTDSLLIWSRNFTLLQVFLLAWLLVIWVLPQTEMPSLEMRWILLFVVLFLWFAAVMAGLYNMVSLACDRFLSRSREQALREITPMDALTLFKAFLPGVSRFFMPIVGGYLIQLAMAVLLLWPAQQMLAKYWPMMLKMSGLDFNHRLALMKSMSMAQQDDLLSLGTMLMVGMAVFILFGLMTMLWPAFVVYYRNNPLKACFRSMAQFFKDPLTLLSLVVVLVGLRLSLGLVNSLGASGNFILTLISLLMNLFVEIFITIVVFVYVYKTVGKPIPEPEEKETPKAVKSDADDRDRFGD